MPDQPPVESYEQGPVAALRRIAFLLERGREETYKVKAYRNAAAAILPLGEDAVASAAERARSTEIPGIGASTAKAIAAAVRGRDARAARRARDGPRRSR